MCTFRKVRHPYHHGITPFQTDCMVPVAGTSGINFCVYNRSARTHCCQNSIGDTTFLRTHMGLISIYTLHPPPFYSSGVLSSSAVLFQWRLHRRSCLVCGGGGVPCNTGCANMMRCLVRSKRLRFCLTPDYTNMRSIAVSQVHIDIGDSLLGCGYLGD